MKGTGSAVAAGEVLVALLGNPNTGKSTIFNRLTGLRQRIANYPGITVEARRGFARLGEEMVEVLDLPGAYSLAAVSPDERVVVEVLTGHAGRRRPDVVVCVVDATQLKRNLFLASQLAEFDLPMVLALNQWDVAEERGLAPDVAKLEEELGVPVIPTVGTKGVGLDRLREAVSRQVREQRKMRRVVWRDSVRQAVERICSASGGELAEAEAQRVLFDAASVLKERAREKGEELDRAVKAGREGLRRDGLNPAAAEAVLHYQHLEEIVGRVLRDAAKSVSRGGDDSIDRILVHRFWGTLVFLAVMSVVFQSVYAWAGPVMEAIEMATAWVQEAVGSALDGLPIFQSLVVDGVLAGVGSVVVFLPQIFILFFFIALLEDSGYMARAAFLMDKLFGWCGLNGKSFVPLLSGFACAIPGVMAARSLEDPKARLTTVLLTPFMSCSARLPVYVLLIGAFIEPAYGPVVAGWTLLGMHFVGSLVGLPLAFVFNRFVLRIRPQPFILEMTSYKIPNLRNVLLRMWEGGREFLVRAGTVILAFSVVIWALLYFPRDPAVAERTEGMFVAAHAISGEMSEEQAAELDHLIEGAYLENSYLGRFGKAVQPVFALAGFDWKITVGVLASFPAREVIIATLGIIYNLGGDVDEESEGLRGRMAAEQWTEGARMGQPVFTIPVVFAVMVFFALCMQCGATVAVIGRQVGWRWAVGSFVVMTALAWVGAVVVFQAGTALGL